LLTPSTITFLIGAVMAVGIMQYFQRKKREYSDGRWIEYFQSRADKREIERIEQNEMSWRIPYSLICIVLIYKVRHSWFTP
jgi:hypothetical protein